MKKNGEYYEYIGCVHIHTTYSDGSKSLEDVAAIADSGFTPVFLRNATAFGFSPRFGLGPLLGLNCRFHIV